MGLIPIQWGNMYYTDFASKKPIETKIYKDFFTIEELAAITDCINKQKELEFNSDFYAPVIQSALSRVHIEVNYPKDILKCRLIVL